MNEDEEVAKLMKLRTKLPGKPPLADPKKLEAEVKALIARSKRARKRYDGRRNPRNPARVQRLEAVAADLATVSHEMSRLRGAAQWRPRYDTPSLRASSKALSRERTAMRKLIKRGTITSDGTSL